MKNFKKAFRLSRRKIIIISLLGAVALLLTIVALSQFSSYEVLYDVKYGDTDANVMDIYIPSSAYGEESVGCVLFIHGGAWMGGDKSEEAARCRLVASRGYVAATVNYTLWSEENSEDYTVFGVLDELDAALLKVKGLAAERGITLDKVATSGYSAGAHLSMLYSFSHRESAPLDIAFTANMAGPADISPEIWGEDMAAKIATILTGEKIDTDILYTQETLNLLKSVSPISYIDEKTPPTIIMQGGKDPVVPPQNAENTVEALCKASVTHKYVYLKNSDHALIHNPIKRVGYYTALLNYCKAYLN